MVKQETISCACGCGKQLEKYVKTQSGNYYERRFIHGHNAKKNDGKQRRVQHYRIKQEIVLCACGCGGKLKKFHKVAKQKYWLERKYLRNHHFRGKKLDEEHKRKLLAATGGRKWKIAWRKGMEKRRSNPKWKASVGNKAMKRKWDKRGRKPPLVFVCAYCGKHNSIPSGTRNKGFALRFCNKECRVKFHVGENHPYWVGPNKKPYPSEWTPELKESIRKRDGYRCQHCMKKKKETLHVHHKNADKSNCSPRNLISLCKKCHRTEQARMVREGTPTP